LIDEYVEEIKSFIDKFEFNTETDEENLFGIPINNEIKDYFNISDNRLRNLKIKLFHYWIKENTDVFTINELRKSLYFKISDIIFYTDKLFDVNDDEFIVKEEVLVELNKYKDKNQNLPSDIREKESEFKNHYKYLKDNISDLHRLPDWQDRIEEMNELTVEIHWKYMPIYEEYMLENRGIIPENNIEEYYDHYHSLEDLFRVMIGEGLNWKTTGGDLNLENSLNFEVFTSRWGHKDRYRIKRKIYGWEVKHISINGMTKKNGEGALFGNFRQDGVFYPKEGVKYALEILWKDADKIEMEVDELQNKMQDIADWVSSVEKATTSKQPSWVNYY